MSSFSATNLPYVLILLLPSIGFHDLLSSRLPTLVSSALNQYRYSVYTLCGIPSAYFQQIQFEDRVFGLDTIRRGKLVVISGRLYCQTIFIL